MYALFYFQRFATTFFETLHFSFRLNHTGATLDHQAAGSCSQSDGSFVLVSSS